MKEGFQPVSCRNNSIKINDKKFVIGPFTDTANKSVKTISVEGICSIDSKMKIADAAEMLHSANGSSASNPSLPIVTGTIELSTNEKDIYWYINPLDIARTRRGKRKNNYKKSKHLRHRSHPCLSFRTETTRLLDCKTGDGCI